VGRGWIGKEISGMEEVSGRGGGKERGEGKEMDG